jgi:hypothetical protein
MQRWWRCYWTATLEIDLDHSDAEMVALLVTGAAVTLFLYYDETNAKGYTAAGVVTSAPITVSGTAINHASITVGGTAAMAAI